MLKKITIFIMSFFYVYIGVKHFTDPDYFLGIMPPYIGWHLELVYISGFFEVIFGLGLLSKYRRYSAIGLILLLIAVFPANIYLIMRRSSNIT